MHVHVLQVINVQDALSTIHFHLRSDKKTRRRKLSHNDNGDDGDTDGNQLVNLHLLFHIARKKLPNLRSNSWSSLPGSYSLTIRLMVRGYEPGGEEGP